MDEPLSNLDAKLRVSTRAQLKHLHHTFRMTTIYVTHDQIEAMTLADRVVVMNRGVIQQVAPPSEIYRCPANTFVADFIGSPAMNLVDGTLDRGVFESHGMRVAGLRATIKGDVTLGFRAEDACVVAQGGEIAAPVYAMEFLGEASMINFRLGNALISVKAAKDFHANISDVVHVNVPPDACHLFDRRTGKRITL